MRNLKKFLALVLAMMMAFSLMVTANASTTGTQYGDVSGVTPEFEEAVDVLTGMGVYSGDNGNFKPAANITRAEVAALIYRLATGDVTDAQAGLYARYGNFPDVREDAWYAGYVGYCANAGYIKGRADGTFDPTGDVTGYEALAMILRAIGYDKNGEFTGATWQTEVSALSQQLGILDNVKTTQYGGTLYLAARRDVVADLLFQADAYVRMVNYTPAFGYQPYGDVVSGSSTVNDLAGGIPNNTLGFKIFGLTKWEDGVIIGNQETGERATRVGYAGSTTEARNQYSASAFEIEPISYDAYTYAGNYEVTVNPTAAGAISGPAIVSLGNNWNFKLDTGIDMMGHQVDFWFDWNTRNAGPGATVYAYFDNVVLAEVVKVKAGTATNLLALNATADNTDSTNLYDAMAAAGFSVNGRTGAHWNNSYGKFSYGTVQSVTSGTTPIYTLGTVAGPNTATVAQASPEYLYMVVSNSANKAPDAVIALNLQTAQVTGVDNVNAITSVTVPYTIKTATLGNTSWEFIDDNNRLSLTAQSPVANVASGTLEQDQLVGNSAKTLGQKEIGLAITGTVPYDPARGNTYDNGWFKLQPVTQVKDGVVVSYTSNTVTLQDGTVLEKSIVYDTVVAGSIPQIENQSPNPGQYEYTNYRFYLNDAGKFVGAERMYGSSFIYGTYLDYQTVVNSSTFEYTLTGVNLDGEVVTVPVKTLNTTANALNGTDALGVPFRDTYGQSGIASPTAINGIGVGVYRGFAYGSDNANWTFAGLNNIGVVAGANGTTTSIGIGGVEVVDASGLVAPATNTADPEVAFDGTDGTGTASDSIIIGSTEITLGASYAGAIDVDSSSAISVGTNTDKLYFTENTKFILVSGYGTDSVKAQVFNGISDLKGDSTQVQINLQYTVNNGVAPDKGGLSSGTVSISNIQAGVKMSDMTYLTQSPFLYAQNQVLSRQADVIILPAAAVTRTESTTTRYVGNATPGQINSNPDIGRTATQFTMYNNGTEEKVWVQGLVDGTAGNHTLSVGSLTPTSVSSTSAADCVADTGHDHFYKLIDTGLKANDGQPIYTVELTNLAGTQNLYVASTYSAQTGSFTTNASITGTTAVTAMRNVAEAIITNLNAGNPNPTWPGITNLQTLNEAGSLGNYNPGGDNQYGGNTGLKVSIITGSGNASLTVTQIYVCYQQ